MPILTHQKECKINEIYSKPPFPSSSSLDVVEEGRRKVPTARMVVCVQTKQQRGSSQRERKHQGPNPVLNQMFPLSLCVTGATLEHLLLLAADINRNSWSSCSQPSSTSSSSSFFGGGGIKLGSFELSSKHAASSSIRCSRACK